MPKALMKIRKSLFDREFRRIVAEERADEDYINRLASYIANAARPFKLTR